jgi:plasmid maintenance system antidote protein VapI
MNQLGFPSDVTPQEIERERTLGGSIDLCAKAAGLAPKQVLADLKLDKAQWSRWVSGQEGILWPKLVQLMDLAGNDAPLLWMLLARGYDLSSLRKLESETEHELRKAKERINQLENERVVERRLLSEVLAGRVSTPIPA